MLKANLIYWTIFFVCFIHFVKSRNTTLLVNSFKCAEKSQLRENRTEQLLCCNSTVNNFYTSWSNGSEYLSTFLSTLKALNCPQFQQECRKQTFAITSFTELVYLKFCDRTTLESTCIDKLQQIVERQMNELLSSELSWDEAIQQLDFRTVTDEELLDPCLQIAMLDQASSSQNYFHEVIDALIPFCSITWCGFNEDVINSRSVSVWTCLSSRSVIRFYKDEVYNHYNV